MTARGANYWDRQAQTYDARMVGLERRYFAQARRWAVQRAVGRTLDVGIGTGLNLEYYGDDVEVVGVDQSRNMQGEATVRAGQLGRRLEVHQADATDLPIADHTFDSVVATFALCCVDDPFAALAEAVRVLTPSGSLLLADHVVATAWPLRAAQHLVDLVTVPLRDRAGARPRPAHHRLGTTR